jgi:hypothetical protein
LVRNRANGLASTAHGVAMVASHDDPSPLDPAEDPRDAADDRTRTSPAAGPADDRHADGGGLGEWFRTKDRSFLLFVGLALSVTGVFALVTMVNGLSGGRAAQAVPIPEPSPPDASPPREIPTEPAPEDSQKPSQHPTPRESDQEGQRFSGIVQNGAFTGSIAPWRAEPAAPFSLVDNHLRVALPRGSTGERPASAQITSNSFALKPAQTYTLRFSANAGSAATIVAKVQSPGGTPATVLSQTSGLNAATQSFVFGFTAPANAVPPAVLRFQFAGEGASTATLDDVSIKPA